MKLAEALLMRSDLRRRISALRSRLADDALVQEGDEPIEPPDELLDQLDATFSQLQRLILRINEANLATALADGTTTLTAALAEREVLAMRHSALSDLCDAASAKTQRYGTQEIRWVPTVDVAKLRRQADSVAQRLRELNAAIQEANWRAELSGD